MKIYCECGHTIHDITDYISYKAHFIADQDYEDLLQSVERQVELLAAEMEQPPAEPATLIQQAMHSVRESLNKYTKTLYQCTECGRLFADDAYYKLQIFAPETEDVPKDLLRSVEGDNWKFPLRGHWTADSTGELWWGFGGAEEGIERFTDLEELKKEYFAVFERLKEKDILRDAFLRIEGEMFHQWP